MNVKVRSASSGQTRRAKRVRIADGTCRAPCGLPTNGASATRTAAPSGRRSKRCALCRQRRCVCTSCTSTTYTCRATCASGSASASSTRMTCCPIGRHPTRWNARTRRAVSRRQTCVLSGHSPLRALRLQQQLRQGGISYPRSRPMCVCFSGFRPVDKFAAGHTILFSCSHTKRTLNTNTLCIPYISLSPKRSHHFFCLNKKVIKLLFAVLSFLAHVKKVTFLAHHYMIIILL